MTLNSRWNPITETWTHIVGFCPHCHFELLENPNPNSDLKHTNFSRVQKSNGSIIWVCDECIEYMRSKGKIVDDTIL